MNQFEERIENILQEETKMPDVVNDKVSQAFSAIRQKSNGVNKQKRLKRGIKAAAIAFAVVLCVGTTTFAAVKHFGLLDYFELRNTDLPNKVNEMVVDKVEQQPQRMEGEYVDFHIREYLCDNNLIYMIVETKPKQDSYLVIPQWVSESDSVVELGISGVTEGSIADYAASQGKEVVYAGVSIDTGAPTYGYEFHTEEDGTAIYIISGTYGMSQEETEFTCNTYEYLPDAVNQDDIIRSSFAFSMPNKGKAENVKYTITDTEGADEVGIVLDDVILSETELCIHVEFLYHYAENIPEEQREEYPSIDLDLVDAKGNEYSTVEDGGGWLEPQEDGSFKEIRNYKKAELPSELTIVVKNYEKNETYGTVKLQRQ